MPRSFSRSCSICSLYVGTRSSQPSGVIIPKMSASSAVWGTRDWTKMTDFSGSRPTESQSVTASTDASRIAEVSA